MYSPWPTVLSSEYLLGISGSSCSQIHNCGSFSFILHGRGYHMGPIAAGGLSLSTHIFRFLGKLYHLTVTI